MTEKIIDMLLSIENSEDDLMEMNRTTSGPLDVIREEANVFELANTDYDISEFKQKNEELAIHQKKIQEWKNQLPLLDTKYEMMLKEKEILQEKMKDFVPDSDIILAFKLGTLSHFCYDKKTKFGYFKSEKNLDYGTFPCNVDKNPSELECRWSLLKSFITPDNDTTSDK